MIPAGLLVQGSLHEAPVVTAFCLGAGRGVGKPVLLICWLPELQGDTSGPGFSAFALLRRILLQSLLFLQFTKEPLVNLSFPLAL